jgi:predicted dehydrogenase
VSGLSSSIGADREFLIAGFGSVGRRHLRNLEAIGACCVRLLRTFQSTLPDTDLDALPVETDLAAALAHKPAAVIVANPTAKHLEIAIPAAQAGCHVLLEKPLSHSLEGVDTLLAASRSTGARILVGFQFRFHPSLRVIRDLLRDDAIGALTAVQAHWGEHVADWHPWEDYHRSYSARADLGGGAILTMCHAFDYLHWLVGDVAEVSAMASSNGGLGIDVEDSADITLRFTNDVQGHVHLNYLERPANHFIRLIGRRGTIFWDASSGMVRLAASGAAQEQMFPPPAGFERNTMFLEEMRHFLACVDGSEQPLCTLQDGIHALRISLAAKQSAREGRRIPIGNEACSA